MSESNDAMVTEADARAMIRLVADVSVMHGTLADRKKLLMDGLCKLVEADAWMWIMFCESSGGEAPTDCAICYGGFSPDQINMVIEAQQDSAAPPPENEPLLVLLKLQHRLTVRRQDVLSDDDWYRHPGFAWRQKTGVDHFVYSLHRVNEAGIGSGVGLHRWLGREPFTERQRRMAQIVMEEVRWLHEMSLPDAPVEAVRQLTRRERTVLGLLLHGRQKKQIAEQLRISPHTVGDYTKALYRHFDVSSRGELFRRFMGHELRSPDVIAP